ncbi:tape measure protein [Gallibacterium anatis]
MVSGELRGEELNSVMKQTPGLADAIAKGLGITTAELKAMGKAGELAIPKVIEALKKAKDSVDSDFEKRVMTISQAFTNIWSYKLEKYFLILSLNLVGEMSRL